MNLLLDTHAFIWWDDDPKRLGAAAQAACFGPANHLFLSAASAWEMQIKIMLGKLPAPAENAPCLSNLASILRRRPGYAHQRH
jgi:PIN domain nuclease of toxin-antitoxin system